MGPEKINVCGSNTARPVARFDTCLRKIIIAPADGEVRKYFGNTGPYPRYCCCIHVRPGPRRTVAEITPKTLASLSSLSLFPSYYSFLPLNQFEGGARKPDVTW